MVSGRRVCAATAVAAAFLFCCVCVASGPARADEDEDARFLLFSGRDIWRHGAFSYGGVLIAPGGFEQDGLMMKLLLSGGFYRYRSGALGEAWVVGSQFQIQVMPGWRIKRGNLELKFFFGLDWQSHKLWPDDPDNRVTGNLTGMRFTVEAWYEPTPASVVIGDLSLTSVGANNSGRLAYGWIPFGGAVGNFYVGPEIQYFVADAYRNMRVGLHITSMKTETTEWSAAGGWASDTDGQVSPYLRLGLSRRIGD